MSVQKKLDFSVEYRDIEMSARSYYRDNESWEFYRKVPIPDSEKRAGINFPGRGLMKDNCGTFSKAFICSCHHTKRAIYHSCNRLDCPICYQRSINRSVKRIDYKFFKIRKMLGVTMKNFRLRHFTFNVLWDINEKNYAEKRKEMNEILMEQGLSGILILHLYRVREQKIVIPWSTDPNKTKVTKIKYLKYFPHFHFVGSGSVIDYDSFKEKYGFTYSNISSRKAPYYISKRRKLRNIVGYILTHSAHKQNGQSYTWNNEYANNKLRKINVVDETDDLKCPHCQESVFLIKNQPLSEIGSISEGFTLVYDHYLELDFRSTLKKKIRKYDFCKIEI